MRTFAEIADTVVKESVSENVLYKVLVNTLFNSLSEKGAFLANCENIRWNRVIAEIFVF